MFNIFHIYIHPYIIKVFNTDQTPPPPPTFIHNLFRYVLGVILELPIALSFDKPKSFQSRNLLRVIWCVFGQNWRIFTLR